jgi:hypothetical protein
MIPLHVWGSEGEADSLSRPWWWQSAIQVSSTHGDAALDRRRRLIRTCMILDCSRPGVRGDDKTKVE